MEKVKNCCLWIRNKSSEIKQMIIETPLTFILNILFYLFVSFILTDIVKVWWSAFNFIFSLIIFICVLCAWFYFYKGKNINLTRDESDASEEFISFKKVFEDKLKERNGLIVSLVGSVGMGKTTYLRSLHNDTRKVIYISLFNRSSLDEIKSALISSYYKNQTFFHRVISIFENSHFIKPYSNSIKDVFISLNLKNEVIIFDDFERFNLECETIKIFMGYVCQLRDENNCKIVLVHDGMVNDNSDIADKNYFQFLDKLIDRQFYYCQQQNEPLDIILSRTQETDDIKELTSVEKKSFENHLKKMNVKNLRMIKKMLRFYTDIFSMKLKGKNEDVINYFIHYYALYFYCFYSNHDQTVPSLKYITNDYEKDLRVRPLNAIEIQSLGSEYTNRVYPEYVSRQYYEFLCKYEYEKYSGEQQFFEMIKDGIKCGYLVNDKDFNVLLNHTLIIKSDLNMVRSKLTEVNRFFLSNFSLDEKYLSSTIKEFLNATESYMEKYNRDPNTVEQINNLYKMLNILGKAANAYKDKRLDRYYKVSI